MVFSSWRSSKYAKVGACVRIWTQLPRPRAVREWFCVIDATSLLLVGLGDAFSSCRASPPVQKSSGRVYRRDLSAEARVRVLKGVFES